MLPTSAPTPHLPPMGPPPPYSVAASDPPPAYTPAHLHHDPPPPYSAGEFFARPRSDNRPFDADLETYKTTIKRQVKNWYAVVSSRKNQEWLILHVVRPDARTHGGNFFQLKGSVLDKLKGDFNTDRTDRCVQLAWNAGSQNPAVWAEFLNKLKDGLLSSFVSAISQREDEVKRSESQRQMPGWNFCTFFTLKVRSLVVVRVHALVHYDELEASFYQVLKEKNLSWFGSLITPTPNDDSSPLLSISK
ncbi:hypothetical protein R3P38DRAFT_3168842 [Favolaschia claudopus]|uniref:TRAPPC10/Trs130 N-terminal domain-containing protein n=1 Tax=Favolaschia claudopus TaxID=2862362 RepID=A0AAW0DY98_9AGAR